MLGNDDRLIELCWNVFVVWECALRDRPRFSLGELGDLMQGLLDSEPLFGPANRIIGMACSRVWGFSMRTGQEIRWWMPRFGLS